MGSMLPYIAAPWILWVIVYEDFMGIPMGYQWDKKAIWKAEVKENEHLGYAGNKWDLTGKNGKVYQK